MSDEDFPDESPAVRAERLFEMGVQAYEKQDLAASVKAWQEAAQIYVQLIDAGHVDFRPNQAHTWMNLGNALQTSGQLSAAVMHYENALKNYTNLIKEGRLELRPDQIMTWVNLGVALTNMGQLTMAVKQYQEAMKSYVNLIKEGHVHLRPQQANTSVNLGNTLWRMGQLTKAVAQYQLALKNYSTLIEEGYAHLRPNQTRTHMNLGNALLDTGRLHEAVEHYQEALKKYASLINAGHVQLRSDQTSTRVNLANALSNMGHLDRALEQYQEALKSYISLIEVGYTHLRPNQAHTWVNLGNAFLRMGQLSEAITYYKKAWQSFADLIEEGHTHLCPDQAITGMNLGNVLSDMGQLHAAVVQYKKALQSYDTLIKAGHVQLRSHQADTWMELGNVMQKMDKLSEAVTEYRKALKSFAKLIESGHLQLRPDQANAQVNLGNALRRMGGLNEAVMQYREALNSYISLIKEGHVQHRPNQAHTWMNLGNALWDMGNLSKAVEQYQQAINSYTKLIKEGHVQLRPDQALAEINLGGTLSDMGELSKSVAQYQKAQQLYKQEAEAGRWQHHCGWVNSVGRMAEVVAQMGHEDTQVQEQSLRTLQQAITDLQQLPRLDSDLHAQHLKAWFSLNRLCQALAAWVQPVANTEPDAWARQARPLLPQALTLSFDHLGQLLREADPMWLARVWVDVQPHLLTLGEMCLQLGGVWPLTWYLRTQSVRSQRMALMQSDDPDLQALYHDWLQLDALAQQITARSSGGTRGAAGDKDLGDVPDGLLRSVPTMTASQTGGPDPVAALHQQWAALNKHVQARKKELAHLLPEQRAITVQSLHKHLPARQAVVALVELAPGVACLTAHWAGAASVASSSDASTPFTSVAPAGSTPAAQRWSTTVDLSAARSGVDGFELAWLGSADAQLAALAWQARGGDAPRRGMVASAGHDTAAGAQFDSDDSAPTTPTAPDLSPEALDHYVHSLRCAAQPLWAHLQAQGIERVHWLVNGHLHAVPWLHVLGADVQAQGLAWRQYPHAAAWLACHDMANTASTHARLPSAMAWLTHDAQELRRLRSYPDLPSTALERGVGQKAWAQLGVQGVDLLPQQPQWPAHPEQSTVQALFVLAHGEAPSAEASRAKRADAGEAGTKTEQPAHTQQASATPTAGIAAAAQVAQAAIVLGCTPNGQTRYFTAGQLRQVQHARFVVFNSCITGRSQEVMAETLGLVAQVFDHQARFVLGAMVRVDDWEAMLIGSAYQYALMRQWQQGQAPDWVETFTQLQTQVQNGHWPEGFADFLAQAWKDWCRSLRGRVNSYEMYALRRQLNLWLAAHHLQALTMVRHDDWDADWQQLAQAVRKPSHLAQQTIGWYIAHGLG